MTDEQTKKFEAAVAKAFEKYKDLVGDYWSKEYAITENSVEDFVKEVFEELQIKF